MPLEGRTELMQKVEDRADKLVRGLALEALRRMMRKTPVDTGRARGNWRVGVGSPERAADWDVDISDVRTAISAGELKIENHVRAGVVAYVTNALPYIPELEDGHSDQAPQGMVKVTNEELKAIKSRLVAEIRRGIDPT